MLRRLEQQHPEDRVHLTIQNAALDREGKPEAGATRDTWLVVPSHKEKLTMR
jgi:hypothetical protein